MLRIKLILLFFLKQTLSLLINPVIETVNFHKYYRFYNVTSD